MIVHTTHWDIEGDVVVVGFGVGGAVAAVAAHDAGAHVVVLEKQETAQPYTNSFMSGGGFICPSDEKMARTYMDALCQAGSGHSWTDPDAIRAWAELTCQNKAWLERMGAVFQLNRRGGAHHLPGSESIWVYRFAGMGPGMMSFFYEQVARRSIVVARGARGAGLLRDGRDRIVGVAAHCVSDQKLINVRADRAVILATGGFEFDEPAKLQFLRGYPCYFASSPWNTGDGIRMALGVGAQLWHMNCCAAGAVLKFPEMATGMLPAFGGSHWLNPSLTALPKFGGAGFQARHADRGVPVAGYVITDRQGKRYADENIKSHEFSYDMYLFDSKRLLYPRIPSYWIFDSKRMVSGALAAPMRVPKPRPSGIYEWSSDNQWELSRGWIKESDTLSGLALKINVEPAILVKTVEEYNGFCRNGADPQFGREPTTLLELAAPPYHAVELWPGGLNTMGGPRRNAQAQVISADGSPIPRLYAVGELGSMYGMLYPGGGGNVAECLAFGRIAGHNAAHSSPA